MAGFRRSTNSNSSSAQVSAPTHSHSAAKQPSAPANALSTSTAAQSTHRRSALAVAGRHPPSVAGAGREVAASLSSRAPATIPATANVPSTAPTGLPAQKATLPVVAGRQLGPRPNLSSSAAGTSRQVAAWPAGRAPSTVSAAGEVNGPPRGRLIQAQTPSEAVPHGAAGEPAGAAMDGVESGQRAIRGSRRVARLMRATGTNWQTVQLQAQQTQAALDTAQSDATAWAGMSSRDRDEEELRTESQRWHAAQPPPPPETLRYINIDEEVYTGDPDDEGAYLDWLLRLED
ncbi:hypothetical protein FRC01_002850 [Tulasnella sp. 417]|nr:hypothetical protein FRC01_002850 [Tulasnella sp. 417]